MVRAAALSKKHLALSSVPKQTWMNLVCKISPSAPGETLCLSTHTHNQITSCTHTLSDKLSKAFSRHSSALAMYGTVNGPNLDKDSSQIVVCPEREAAVCSCVSVSLVNAFVVIATPGETARQSRHGAQ